MIVTAQPALPTSNRGSKRYYAPPPAAQAQPGPQVPLITVQAAAPPAAPQGRLAVPAGKGPHTLKATTAAPARSTEEVPAAPSQG